MKETIKNFIKGKGIDFWVCIVFGIILLVSCTILAIKTPYLEDILGVIFALTAISLCIVTRHRE